MEPMAEQWYYARGGQHHGPVTEDQLRQLAASGQVHPTDLVWNTGMANWIQANEAGIVFPPASAAFSGPPAPPAGLFWPLVANAGPNAGAKSRFVSGCCNRVSYLQLDVRSRACCSVDPCDRLDCRANPDVGVDLRPGYGLEYVEGAVPRVREPPKHRHIRHLSDVQTACCTKGQYVSGGGRNARHAAFRCWRPHCTNAGHTVRLPSCPIGRGVS